MIDPTVKAMAEQKNWDTAHQWYLSVPLVYRGVDIGDAMTYDVLRILGRLFQMDFERQEAEQQAAALKQTEATHVETYPTA